MMEASQKHQRPRAYRDLPASVEIFKLCYTASSISKWMYIILVIHHNVLYEDHLFDI